MEIALNDGRFEFAGDASVELQFAGQQRLDDAAVVVIEGVSGATPAMPLQNCSRIHTICLGQHEWLWKMGGLLGVFAAEDSKFRRVEILAREWGEWTVGSCVRRRVASAGVPGL